MRPASTLPRDSALPALEGFVREMLGVPPGADVREKKVNSRVYRLRCDAVNGTARSFVAKRLAPEIARRNELVVRRWLPAVGLGDAAPPLLAVVAERDSASVWHLYEDLGDSGLDAVQPDGGRVRMAVAVIARIHLRFAGHALTPELRLWGGDLGVRFYVANVRDAIASLEAMRSRRPGLGEERSSVCDRLLARLARLRDEETERAEALTRFGGPETLLHGDLWPMNVLVGSHGEKPWVRLIDWDHAAVGPVAYDLSTFLSRFAVEDRMPILRLYEQEIAGAGWALPSDAELNQAFETAELGRISNRVIWPALAAWKDGVEWAVDALEEVERWFERLAPVLPLDEA
jgi:Phosphotransferase enzyme family